MLSIDDVKQVSFRRANFGGYKPEDVDAFVDDVQDSYEKILEENKNLHSEIENLRSKIDKIYAEEGAIRKVILNAQNIAESSLNQAKEKTEEIVEKAVKKSNDLIDKAKEEVKIQNQISERLKAEAVSLKNKLKDIYKEHLEIIGKIPGDVRTENDKTKEKKIEEKKEKKDFIDISSEDISGGFSSAQSDVEEIKKENISDLKFGKDYNIEDESKPKGAFSGLFKRKN